MCRGKKYCTELGLQIENWSRTSPLVPPQWFGDQIDLFAIAFEYASTGDVPMSLGVLSKIKNNELREWYCEHGQTSGRFRNKVLKIPRQQKSFPLDPVKSPNKYMEKVFERDHFTCQYCGIKVISKELLNKYAKIVGSNNFCATGTNQERHGIVLAFRANADHILPCNIGGKTNLDNLITCCWSCNYGKAGFTLGQLRLDNPKNNKFVNLNWHGLSEVL